MRRLEAGSEMILPYYALDVILLLTIFNLSTFRKNNACRCHKCPTIKTLIVSRLFFMKHLFLLAMNTSAIMATVLFKSKGIPLSSSTVLAWMGIE